MFYRKVLKTGAKRQEMEQWVYDIMNHNEMIMTDKRLIMNAARPPDQINYNYSMRYSGLVRYSLRA